MELTALARKEGNCYVAWTPELDVASQGHTMEEAMANLKEAVELFLEDEEIEVPPGPVWVTRFEVEHGAPSLGGS